MDRAIFQCCLIIFSYISIVEKLPTYGIHYYEVKNKQGIPWWLGLSFKGIAQFDYNDKRTPRRVCILRSLMSVGTHRGQEF